MSVLTVTGSLVAGRAVAALVAALALLGAVGVDAQSTSNSDASARITPLLGRWTGTSEGKPGTASVERQYSRALGDRFIRVTNRSTYAPQAKNPKGEIHQDEGFFSVDRARKRLVFRQFHVEGFVNQYVEEPQSIPQTIVFTSEAIENIPAGFRARETYTLRGPDEFEEVFELAEPGKPFEVYSRARFTRAR